MPTRFSKRHHIAIAKILSESRLFDTFPSVNVSDDENVNVEVQDAMFGQWVEIRDKFCAYLQEDNRLFSRTRFETACKEGEVEVRRSTRRETYCDPRIPLDNNYE